MEDELVSVEEAARIKGVPTYAIYKAIGDGTFTPVAASSTQERPWRMVKRSELEAWQPEA